MDGTSTFNFVSCNKKPEVSIYYCDQEEAELLAKANAEFDPAKRKLIVQELQRVHFANSPILALVEWQDTMGVGKRVRNFKNVKIGRAHV